MTKKEAAILLVDMISDLCRYGADNQIYHEAVAIACAELLNAETAKVKHFVLDSIKQPKEETWMN